MNGMVARVLRKLLGRGSEAPRLTRGRRPARRYDVLSMDALEQLVRDDYEANCRKSTFKIRPAFRHLREHFGPVFLIDRDSGELFCLKGRAGDEAGHRGDGRGGNGGGSGTE